MDKQSAQTKNNEAHPASPEPQQLALKEDADTARHSQLAPDPVKLRESVSGLLDEFLASPHGSARPILEAWLVAYLASVETRREEEALGVASESRRHAAAMRQENERLRRQGLRVAEDNHRLAAEATRAEMARRALLREFRMIEAGAAAHEITQEEIVRRITAAIGLSGPLVERVEPEGGG